MTPEQLTEGKRRLAVYRVARPVTVVTSNNRPVESGPGGLGGPSAPGVSLAAGPGAIPKTTNTPRGRSTGTLTEVTTQRNLSRDMVRARSDIDLLSASLGAALTARDEANTKLAENTKELERLRATVVRMQQQQGAGDSGEGEITALISEVEALKNASTALGIKNQELEDAAALRGRSLDEAKAVLAQANSRLAELGNVQQQLNNAIAARDAAVSDRESISTELNATRQELAVAQSSIAVVKSTAAAPDPAATQQIASLTTQIDDLKGRLADAESAQQNATAQLAELTSDLTSTRTKLARSQSLNESQQEQSAIVQAELALSWKEADLLKTDLSDAQAIRDAAIAARDAAIADRDGNSSALTNTRQELAEAQSTIAATQRNLQAEQTKSNEQQSALKRTQDEITSLQQQLTEAQTAAATPDPAATQRINTLGNQITDLQSRLKEAQTEQADTADRLTTLSQNLDAAQVELARSKSLNESQEEQESKTQAELARATKDADQLKQILADAQSDRNDAIANLAKTTHEVTALRATVAKLERAQSARESKAVTALKNELAALKEASVTLEYTHQALVNTAADHSRELDDTQAELVQANTQIAALTKIQSELRSTVAESDAAHDATTNDRDRIAAELNTTREKLADVQSSSATVQNSLQAAQTLTQDQARELNQAANEVVSLQQQLTAAQAAAEAPDPAATQHIASLTDQITALNTQLSSAQTAQVEATDRVTELTGKLEGLQTERDQANTRIEALFKFQGELQNALTESDAAHDATTNDRDRIDAELNTARQELADIQNTVATTQNNLQEERANSLGQQLKIQVSQNEITRLDEQLQAARAAVADREKIATELITTRQELVDAHKTIATIKSTLQEAQTLTHDQARELNQATNNADSLRQQLIAAQAAADAPDPAATQHIATLTNQISTLSAQLSAAQSAQAEATDKLTELTGILETTQADLTSSQTLNESQLAQIATAQKELADGANELAALRVSVTKLKDQQTASSSAEIMVLQDQLQRLQADTKAMSLRNQALEETATESNLKLNETHATLADANTRIAELTKIERSLQTAIAAHATAGPDPVITGQIASLTRDLAVARNEFADAKKQVEQQQTLLDQQDQKLTTLQSELADGKSKLDNSESLISTLQGNLANALAVAAEPDEESVARVSKLTNEMAALNSQLVSAQSAQAEASAQVSELTGSLAANQAELSANQGELAALQATVKKLQTEQSTLYAGNEKISELNQELEQLKNVATALGEQNQELEDAAALRGRTLDETRVALERANDEIQSLNQIKDELQIAIAARDAAMADRASITAALATTRQELDQAQNSLSTTQKYLQEERANTNIQQRELKRTQDEFASLQEQLSIAQAASAAPDTNAANQITALNNMLASEKTARSEATAQLDSLATDLGAARVQLAQLKMANDDLSSRLSVATQPIVSDPADTARITTLEGELQQVRDQLAQIQSSAPVIEDHTTALNELNGQIETLNAELALEKAGRTDADAQSQALVAQLESVQIKLDDTEALLATRTTDPVTPVVDDAEMAAMQVKLDATLGSYNRLEAENNRLKVSSNQLSERLVSLESQLAGVNSSSSNLTQQLNSSNAIAAQVDPLREQLRQTLDQLNSTRRENAQLRTRLAIIVQPRTGTFASPTRPGSVRAATVTAPVVATQPTPAPVAARPQSHTVVSGDTLSGISLRYYGTRQRWPEIYEANRATLPNERSLRIGMQIIIP